jgi:hypothetical protein
MPKARHTEIYHAPHLDCLVPHLTTHHPIPPLQFPSNSPYSHWSWSFINASLVGDKSCGAAVASEAYDYWLGNSSSTREMQNSSFFQTASTLDLKYGW